MMEWWRKETNMHQWLLKQTLRRRTGFDNTQERARTAPVRVRAHEAHFD